MRRGRWLGGLVVVTALAVAAVVWSQRESDVIARSGELLFPGLLERLNDVREVTVTTGGERVTLRAGDEGWVVVEQGGYPADGEEIRKLLIGSADLRQVEPKTSKPELYPELEVGDPAAEGAQSIGYGFKAAEGALVADFVVGKRRILSGSTDFDQYFVRVAADPQVWLVEGQIPKHREGTDWLDREVVRIGRDRVHRVTVRHPDGPSVRVVKRAPGDAGFELLGIPPGHEVDLDYAVESIATTPADLTLSGVAPVEEVDFAGEEGLAVELETFDGLRIEIETAPRGEDTFLRLRAEHDPALPALTGPSPAAPSEDGAPSEDDAASETAAAPAAPPAGLKSPEEVAAEVAALNERWSPWAYRVADYVLDALGKRMDDLVAAPASEGGPDPAAAPARE